MRKSTKAKRSGLTARKARKILKDGKVRGHKLTAKQKRFFGSVIGSKGKKK